MYPLHNEWRCKYLVLGRDRSYVVEHHSDPIKKFSETDIINMLECLIDNIFVMFGGLALQQTVRIPMGTNCASLLADVFLYSYEVDLIKGLLKKNERKLARSFNVTYYIWIYDILSLNNSRFDDFVDRIYPIGLAIKDTTDTDWSAAYLDLHEIECEGRLRTKHYDKRDDFNFTIENFPFICSSSFLNWYDISEIVIPIRMSLLTRKLMNQVFLLLMLKSSLRQSYGDHHNLFDRYGIYV